MKKITLAICLLFFITSAFAQQIKNVALLSIFANREIEAPGFNGLATMIETLSKDKNFQLDSISARYYEKFKSAIAPKMPFSLISGTDVYDKPGYQNLLDPYTVKYADSQVTKVEKYLAVTGTGLFKNVEAIKKSFTLLGNPDAVIITNIQFELVKQMEMMGVGTAKIYGYAYIRIFNKDGDVIFKLNSKGKSKDDISFAFGGDMFDTSQMQKLANQSFENLLVDIDNDMPKQIEKMKKKLSKK